ncbi:methyltransferase domain-containing protein [Actinomycetospora lutea]|uniref:methyltransferase domain-containing protein n=1 Tax=Actinomycetospora lutea TaxID=663604 RepID=UPI002365F94A|nr:methyltransferase domain-containing protein [Actinomycetospora lutea]MDD7939757.1 methyltransferase domain-containing protein [Actinomycetospora lutea]
MTSDDGYLLDNRRTPAGHRLTALGELFDASTFRHLDALGVGPGWRCWEVGAGGRSVPVGLAERVGPDGSVIATDVDTSWLGTSDGVLEVRRHDVGSDAPPATDLDLVHARLVLTHVPARDRALAAMVASLRPGGWLVVEDADPGLQPLLCPEDRGPAEQLANRLRRGFRALMADRDADLALGRTLPRRLREHGLVDVVADAFFPIAGPACTALEIATVEQIRPRLVESGVASPDDVDRHLENLRAGRLPDLATSPMVTARGRRVA